MKITRVLGLALVLSGIVLGSRGLRAQTSADSAGVVLGLARDLEGQGKHELAETLLRLVIERFPGSPAADSARTALRDVGKARERTGGVGAMTAWGGLYGAWVGIAIPAALTTDGPEGYGAGLLIGGPAGLLAARSYAKASNLSGGQARAIAWGSIWGSFQGAGWRDALGIGDREVSFCYAGSQAPCFTDTVTPDGVPFTAALLGGFAGIGTAAVLAHSREMSSGTIAAIEWGSIWGSWFGIATAVLFDIQGDHGPLTYTLVAGNLGLVTTAALSRRWNLTPGRPWLVSAVGMAGLAAGLGVDLLVAANGDDRALMVPPLAGSIAGLLAGVALTRPKGTAALKSGPVGDQAGLLRLAHGHLTFTEPVVIPAAQPTAALGGRIVWRPGVRIPILSVALP